MSFLHPNLKGIVAAVAAVVMNSIPLAAQSADPPGSSPAETIVEIPADSTDEAALLQALANSDPSGAKRAERQLQALWDKSGSAAMDLLLRRGRDAMKVDDTRAAIEHLTALTDHAPEFAEGWHARASAYFDAGLYGPALADLERALALNPNNYKAIYGLGAILETFGDQARAYEAYQKAQAINPYYQEVTEALERLGPHVQGEAL